MEIIQNIPAMLAFETTKLKNLLLGAATADTAEIESLFFPFGFEDWHGAYRCLKRLITGSKTPGALVDFLPTLLQSAADSANPDKALINFEHFTDNFDDTAALFMLLKENPRIIEMLVILFAGSQFLTDILLRNPESIEQIKEHKWITNIKNRQKFTSEAHDVVVHSEQKTEALCRYQRSEFLRIGTGDLFGTFDLQAVTSQLSNLARAIIKICLELVAAKLNFNIEGFTVFALGKLGGRELNYSSDIDLFFLGTTQRPEMQKLGRHLIEVLTRVTPEGFLYRVDMRLRPWGGVGQLVPGIDESISYMQNTAQLWEKQAFYKARVVAGDEVLGLDFIQQIKPYIQSLPKDDLNAEIRAMKQKIELKLKQQGKAWGQVKSGAGSIRDIEFVTQYLQITNGRKFPAVHSRNTLDGLARLAACKLLSPQDYRVAVDGYIFLRSVEHHLQIMHYRQTHQLPQKPREINYLARRLGFQGNNVGKQLIERYEQHSEALRRLYKRHLLQEKQTELSFERQETTAIVTAEITRHLSRLDAAYAATFNQGDIELHARLANSLTADKPIAVETKKHSPQDWEVTIVGFDYNGELALICGLFFYFDMNIVQGSVFTYELDEGQLTAQKTQSASTISKRRMPHKPSQNGRRKIVDVFRVQPAGGEISTKTWQQYTDELTQFVRDLHHKKQLEVQGEIARRVATKVQEIRHAGETLLPVDISIDNTLSKNYTILRIDAADTIGFLYELTNALSLNGIYIVRVMVSSIRNRVHDTLFLTNVHGKKINDPQSLYQLRLATVLVKHFTHLLPQAPNPQSAMVQFREFVSHIFTRPQWTDAMASLERPEVLDALTRLFGVSDFLWSDFLRMQHENIFPLIHDLSALKNAKSREQLQTELESKLAGARSWSVKQRCLNEFKDREMFRIDMRFIQGALTEFKQFSHELTNLAEVVVESAVDFSYDKLSKKYGEPTLDDRSICPWTLCALGKFGGRGLGFASDIELMFIYHGTGETNGPEKIANRLFFEKLVNLICQSITSKNEGIFEIDLRLRPYGKRGNLAVSIDAFRKYYSVDGTAWDYERQALVRLRPFAGDSDFAARITALRDKYVYFAATPDVAAMRAMRERQLRQLVAGGAINAKFSSGALVDLEYLVQFLQIKYGRDNHALRVTSTSKAMAALNKAGIIEEKDYQHLQQAHYFLRKLIDALRMVRGNARDLNIPPDNSKEFSFLARRLEYRNNPAAFKNDLEQHTSFVQNLSAKLLK